MAPALATAGPRVAALGGGHGLSSTLRALRRVSSEVTAVVGVSDDGGSSGRIRRELGLIPPGDLRMALAALCGDDTWGRTWSTVLQHRFAGDGELAGHAVGNLLISALWEETGDVVGGLDWVGALLGAQGRVLPVAVEPVQLVAQVRGLDPADPHGVSVLKGQASIAHTDGDVIGVELNPPDPEPCEEALRAIRAADAIVLGPGSWYTSIMPHLQMAPIRETILESPGLSVLVLNLGPQEGETSGFTADRYLRNLHKDLPEMTLDRVIADPGSVADLNPLLDACGLVGATLVLERVAARGPGGRILSEHDPDLLASVLGRLLKRRS